jgi:hypothetical protein
MDTLHPSNEMKVEYLELLFVELYMYVVLFYILFTSLLLKKIYYTLITEIFFATN